MNNTHVNNSTEKGGFDYISAPVHVSFSLSPDLNVQGATILQIS
jgi:hypothetical protein